MKSENIKYNNWKLDNNEEEEEELGTPEVDKPMPGMMLKKQEELFFKNRSIYLWGPVDDKSSKDIVNKLLLLDAENSSRALRMTLSYSTYRWVELKDRLTGASSAGTMFLNWFRGLRGTMIIPSVGN